MVLSLDVMHKVGCTGYALGFMNLDKEVSLPTRAEVTMVTLGAPLPAQLRDHQWSLMDWALQTDREVPGRMRRLQGFAVGPLRLDLNGHVRHAQ